MHATKKYLDELTYKVIGCAIEVHKQIGPGLLESVYEKCFLKELDLQGIEYQKQVWVPLEYKGLELTFLYGNVTKAKRHPYQFSLPEYF